MYVWTHIWMEVKSLVLSGKSSEPNINLSTLKIRKCKYADSEINLMRETDEIFSSKV